MTKLDTKIRSVCLRQGMTQCHGMGCDRTGHGNLDQFKMPFSINWVPAKQCSCPAGNCTTHRGPRGVCEKFCSGSSEASGTFQMLQPPTSRAHQDRVDSCRACSYPLMSSRHFVPWNPEQRRWSYGFFSLEGKQVGRVLRANNSARETILEKRVHKS